jgi:hypothetical protein
MLRIEGHGAGFLAEEVARRSSRHLGDFSDASGAIWAGPGSNTYDVGRERNGMNRRRDWFGGLVVSMRLSLLELNHKPPEAGFSDLRGDAIITTCGRHELQGVGGARRVPGTRDGVGSSGCIREASA